jgi:hypothetical protein
MGQYGPTSDNEQCPVCYSYSDTKYLQEEGEQLGGIHQLKTNQKIHFSIQRPYPVPGEIQRTSSLPIFLKSVSMLSSHLRRSDLLRSPFGFFDYNSLCIRGSVVAWGTMLQAGRSRVRFRMRSLNFFNWPNPSSRTVALGSTQPLTEVSTRNLPGGKGRPALKADVTAICEPIV